MKESKPYWYIDEITEEIKEGVRGDANWVRRWLKGTAFIERYQAKRALSERIAWERAMEHLKIYKDLK